MILYSNLTKVTLPLHNFALVVKYNCIEKKLSPVGSQGVLSERNVGYISCKQAFCSKVWNICRNSPAKVFSFLHLFSYFLHILNCRSVSELSLKWGHVLLQAAGDFFKRKEIHFENAETWQRGTKDSWDLFELDRVWNWCYLNKGKMFSSSSSKWIYIYSSRCCIYYSKLNSTLSLFEEKGQILEFYGGLFENDIKIIFFSTLSPIYGSDSPVEGK